MNVNLVLDREPRPEPIAPLLEKLRGETVLITGGLGSLGLAVTDVLDDAGIDLVNTDVRELDVTDAVQTEYLLHLFQPTVILHLAGAKHAPEGELDPVVPTNTHVTGTANVVQHAPRGCRVVTASTCKSCDPETAYGASKLIAERITLNAGHSVARFHNVVETAGNVFELWDALPDDAPITVAACRRYFIALDEAVALLLYAATAETPGRFMASPGRIQSMWAVAERLYSGREMVSMQPRRGDRVNEPFMARCETGSAETMRIVRIHSPYDRAEVAA